MTAAVRSSPADGVAGLSRHARKRDAAEAGMRAASDVRLVDAAAVDTDTVVEVYAVGGGSEVVRLLSLLSSGLPDDVLARRAVKLTKLTPFVCLAAAPWLYALLTWRCVRRMMWSSACMPPRRPGVPRVPCCRRAAVRLARRDRRPRRTPACPPET